MQKRRRESGVLHKLAHSICHSEIGECIRVKHGLTGFATSQVMKLVSPTVCDNTFHFNCPQRRQELSFSIWYTETNSVFTWPVVTQINVLWLRCFYLPCWPVVFSMLFHIKWTSPLTAKYQCVKLYMKLITFINKWLIFKIQ